VIPIPTKIHRRYGRTVMVLTAENTVPAAALDETAVAMYEKAAEDFSQYCTSAADAIAEDARANGMRRFVTARAGIMIRPIKTAPNEVKISITAVLPDSRTHTELHTWRRLKNVWLMTKRENLHTADNNL